MDASRDRAAWLKGPGASCAVIPEKLQRPWRLVLFGAPGVGKGTQAGFLSAGLKACHLSTGDVFRAAKSLPECDRTPAMSAALDYMRRGELVPDMTVLDMVRERVKCLQCHGGFLLDGFPRTLTQAQALQTLLKTNRLALDGVISYELPIDVIVERLSGRRTCPKCQTVYHVTALPPKQEGICDKCGSTLLQRDDDRPEAVRIRMETYAKSTTPLVDFYRRRGLLVPVQAAGNPEETYRRTLEALGVQ